MLRLNSNIAFTGFMWLLKKKKITPSGLEM